MAGVVIVAHGHAVLEGPGVTDESVPWDVAGPDVELAVGALAGLLLGAAVPGTEAWGGAVGLGALRPRAPHRGRRGSERARRAVGAGAGVVCMQENLARRRKLIMI